jgi:fructose-1,6-bisphosphatase I
MGAEGTDSGPASEASPEATTDPADFVETVVDAVASTVPAIRGGLPGRRMAAEGQNPSGERQLAADVHADRLLLGRMRALAAVGEYASEERPAVVDAGDGPLSVAVDPLDGSSNLKPNAVLGTVLAVYDSPLPADGDALVASAYVLYGPVTTMVVAREGAVSEYLVENGRRRLLRDDVTLPDDPVVYGFGGRVPDWTPSFAAYAREVERELKLRYGGSMIGDVSQVLTYGGVFAYPALESAPEGKLRLQFEGYPVAHLIESAGGRSSDGSQSILDVDPSTLHGRVPVHVGNTSYIDRLEAALADDDT